MLQQEYKKIMVAVDGSATSRAAFEKAAMLTVQNRGELFITHIIDEHSFTRSNPMLDHYDQTLSIPRSSSNPLLAAKTTLAEYKKLAEKHGIYDCHLVIEYGEPEELIAETIPTKHDIDLIIMGATGLNTMERLFIGSVSESVIRHAVCDVLITRSEPRTS